MWYLSTIIVPQLELLGTAEIFIFIVLSKTTMELSIRPTIFLLTVLLEDKQSPLILLIP